MRLSRAFLKQRVNADLVVRHTKIGLTSYAGLELLRRYVGSIRLHDTLRSKASSRLPSSDYGNTSLCLLLLGLLISGARRIGQLRYLEHDPVIRRLTGLQQLPTPRSVTRWLSTMSASGVAALSRVNAEIAADELQALRLPTLTIDVDGSVVSTGLTVERAERGYNPHHRKVPSYYPITAYEARSGLILRCQNRPGNVHDGKAALDFLDDLFAQIDQTLSPRGIEMRMDGAFFRRDVVDRLDQASAKYAIKVPFYPWLHLKDQIVLRERWRRIDDELGYFRTTHRVETWDRDLVITLYRRRVHHETRKNFQLDLFDPDDGHYEYSAITSNLALDGEALWLYMAGRGTHEKVYAELKNDLAFNGVPSRRYEANSAWQQLNVLAFNLVRRFQIDTLAPRRGTGPKRRTIFAFKTLRTLRFECFSRAGIISNPGGRGVLDVGTASGVRSLFKTIDARLAA